MGNVRKSIGVLLVTAAASSSSIAHAEERIADPMVDRANRVTVADPWSTRGTVSALAGVSSVQASIPVAAMETEYAGESRMAGLAIDLHGRRLGFHLDLAASATEQVNAPVDGATGTRLTHAEGALGLGATLVSSRGVYLSAGPALEARATAVGDFSQGNEAVASWQSVVAGGDVRARVFAGAHVYVTASAFAGAIPLHGGWQSVDAASATSTDGPVASARLEDALVFSGHVAAAVRPAEWVAFSAGVGARHATYGYRDDAGLRGEGTERSVRPYVALELLY